MKWLSHGLAAILILSVAVILGCIPGTKFAKPTSTSSSDDGMVTATLGEKEGESSSLPPSEWEKPPPPSSEPQEKRPGTPKRALPASPKEMRNKDEINAAALEFAKEIPDVIHVKTCFSKVFGGWYLLLYLKKGKKISLQHYSWNPITKEWEVSMAGKEIPADKLEYHLKSEIGDEKCTTLK